MSKSLSEYYEAFTVVKVETITEREKKEFRFKWKPKPFPVGISVTTANDHPALVTSSYSILVGKSIKYIIRQLQMNEKKKKK